MVDMSYSSGSGKATSISQLAHILSFSEGWCPTRVLPPQQQLFAPFARHTCQS